MKKLMILAAACMMAAGCIDKDSTSMGETAKEYLEVWMARWNKNNGKDVKPNGLGLYILEDTPGTGDLRVADSTWVYAVFTIRGLDGKITSTDDAAVAKQLGTYVEGYWYGPKYAATGEGVNYAGVDALLEGMKLGGTRRAIIPSWLITTSRYSSIDGYLDACNSNTHLDYTVTITDQTTDINRHQAKRIAAYMAANHPGAKSSHLVEDNENYTANGSFWFISDVSSFNESDARTENESTLKINYTGKRLDGQVFDTSIEKIAIDAGLTSYSTKPHSVTFSSDWNNVAMDSSTSLVDGFKAGLFRMKYPGQKAVVAFTSEHGYGSSAKSGMLPAYTPLIFEIELLKEE